MFITKFYQCIVFRKINMQKLLSLFLKVVTRTAKLVLTTELIQYTIYKNILVVSGRQKLQKLINISEKKINTPKCALLCNAYFKTKRT